MYVRPTTLGDIPAFVALGHTMHEESLFKEYDFSDAKLSSLIKWCIEDDHGVAITLVRGDEVIGGFIGCLYEHFFGTDLQATDMALFIHPDHRGSTGGFKLIKAYIEDAKARGASQIVIANSTGIDQERVAALIERVGFNKVGYVLSMHVPKEDK